MIKEEAVKTVKRIQHGDGLDRDNFPEKMKAILAKELWGSGEFSYGMEYGYILALIHIFNLTDKELTSE